MKLIIQIPAWNEEKHLADAIAALPQQVEGFDEIEVLVVDDGSDDRTAEVARSGRRDRDPSPGPPRSGRGFHHRNSPQCRARRRRHRQHRRGQSIRCRRHTDPGATDPRPIGATGHRRPPGGHPPHFSAVKRLLQKLGSGVVRRLSGTDVRDATSGFRALSRAAAFRLHVFTRFTYTLETILQAGEAGLKVASVPIRVNPGVARPSRLFSSNVDYIVRSLASMARIIVLYNPLRIFLILGSLPVGLGAALLVRFLWFYATGNSPAGHVQSLILAVILVVIGSLIWLAGIMADLTAVNRRLLEEVVERQRANGVDPHI